MKKKKISTPPNRHLIYIGAALLCMILIFAVVISSYVRKFDRTLMEENRSHLTEIADHIVEYIQAIIKDTENSLQIAADTISLIPEGDKRMSYLKNVAQKQNFTYIGYASSDGMLHATQQSESKNISEEEYFQSALAGEVQITGLTRRIFTDKAVRGILMAVPVYGMEKEGNGVLVAMIDIAKLQNVFGVESFGGEGYSYIIDQQGELVLHTKSMDYNNFFMVLKNVEFEEGFDQNTVRSDIELAQPGIVLYNNMGTEQYAYYCPLGINSWTVVNIVAKEVVTGKTTALTKELVLISVAAVIIFLSLLVTTVIVFGISENRRHATEEKSAFLANISHEIRTPMNAIVGISEILLREELPPNQKNYVQTIMNSGKGLLMIINDILDISKIEAGKFIIIEEDYKVESLLADVMTIIGVRMGEKPVELLSDIDQRLPSHLIGDMIRVKQILINLLGNSVKFTEKGYIKLTVQYEPEADGICMKMRVEDTGIGIKKEELDQLFISFSQVNTHYSHAIEGTGLGLAVSKKLIEMMNGSVQVESEYGKGTIFTVNIHQKVPDIVAPIIDTAWPQGCRVLLLEQSSLLYDFYENSMRHMRIPHKVCCEKKTFEKYLQSGEFQYVIADRFTIEEILKKGIPKGICLITLLDLKEYSLTIMEPENRSISVPLFSLQLASILHHNQKDTLTKQSDFVDIYPLPKIRILIVDDNEVNLQVAKGLMEPYHMKMDCVISGSEAIKAVQEKEYDLVLMDHMMPEMDGVETVRNIRALPNKRYDSLPIIALTANSTQDAKEMCLKEGFNGFLTKPIEMAKLNDILKEWLTEVNQKRADEGKTQPMTVEKRSASVFSEEEQQFLKKFQNWKEINFKDGAERMGSLSVYVRILGIYQKSTNEKISQFTEMIQQDFERFVIEIHGIKGASVGIGAMNVSKQAQNLEQMGKENDRKGIEESLPVFLKSVRSSMEEAERFVQEFKKWGNS